MENPITQSQPSVPQVPTPGAAGMIPPTQGWLAKMQPSPWLLRKLLMLAVLVGVGVGAFCWGRRQTAAAKGVDDPDSQGYGKRVVAYLYNDQVAVNREELGEYLIQRFGQDRVRFMVN